METKPQGVETTPSSAPSTATGVETSSSRAPENDPIATIAALQEKIAKQARDLDNYRNVALSIKGKEVSLEDVDWNDPIQREAALDKKIESKLLERGYKETQADYETEIQKVLRENKELRASAQSKQAATAITGGAGAGAGFNSASEVETHHVSPEQLADLRKRAITTLNHAKTMGEIPADKFEERVQQLVKSYEDALRLADK